jgi:dipeptidyl-peptidase III
MKSLRVILIMSIAMIAVSCNNAGKRAEKQDEGPFKYVTEQFGDARILRYQVPGFDSLTLQQKKLIYYLSQAALCGRDITYDQNYRNNLLVRSTLESIYQNYKGEKGGADFDKFVVYMKEVWFNNGIHHHYSTDKFFPECSQDYFATLVKGTKPELLPMKPGQTVDEFIAIITPIIYDPSVAPKRVGTDAEQDLVLASACNFYDGVTQKEVDDFYEALKKADAKAGRDTRVSYGLNSKVVKENGKVAEQVYKVGGLYTQAIEKIVYWLEKALPYAETPEQQESLEMLIDYYKTGNLVTWDVYNVAWVKDLNSLVDNVNGFIEIYGDPLARKATWEAVVNFKNIEATKRTKIISDNAQLFENLSPIDPRFKKKEVKGVSAKVITVAQLGGDCDPTTPIGINLPNANWIRKDHGSKSVTMDNITFAYDQAAMGNGFLEEFAASPEEITNIRENGYQASSLTTDLHECLGHGSGQMNPGITGESLKNYHSPIEESRADLFALYFIYDVTAMDAGLVKDLNVGKAEYDSYIRNGLMTQLVRIQPGKDIQQAHMRDRALISHWVYEKGKAENVIEKITRDGKTYFRINDYDKLHTLFGELLKEVQRITSEGDYKAAKALVEGYGVKVDQELHKEVLERYKKLNIAPYSGFINPAYELVMQNDTIADVKIIYPDDFATQMLHYSKNYSFLPVR